MDLVFEGLWPVAGQQLDMDASIIHCSAQSIIDGGSISAKKKITLVIIHCLNDSFSFRHQLLSLFSQGITPRQLQSFCSLANTHLCTRTKPSSLYKEKDWSCLTNYQKQYKIWPLIWWEENAISHMPNMQSVTNFHGKPIIYFSVIANIVWKLKGSMHSLLINATFADNNATLAVYYYMYMHSLLASFLSNINHSLPGIFID